MFHFITMRKLLEFCWMWRSYNILQVMNVWWNIVPTLKFKTWGSFPYWRERIIFRVEYLERLLTERNNKSNWSAQLLRSFDGCFPNARIAYKILFTIPVKLLPGKWAFQSLSWSKLIFAWLWYRNRWTG